MKLMLLGNCQVEVYRHILAGAGIPKLEVHAVEVWRLQRSQYTEVFERASTADVVVTQELSDAYGELATTRLSSCARAVVVIVNVHFDGYLPDCAYVGPMGKRLKSPVGDYHSRVVYEAWHAGLPLDDAISKVLQYSADSALRAFERAHVELERREASADVKICDRLLDPETGSRSMFTFNHPKIELHKIYLARVFKYLGITLPDTTCTDPLAQHTHWPLYPGVIQAHALRGPHGDELRFVASQSLGGQVFTLGQFVEASYRAYDTQGAQPSA